MSIGAIGQISVNDLRRPGKQRTGRAKQCGCKDRIRIVKDVASSMVITDCSARRTNNPLR